jgi:hypothetical protein
MPINKRDVHDHIVSGEDDAKNGIDYLDYKLENNEAQVFFSQAKQKGSAKFEDEHGYDYTLIHNQDGTYQVEKRVKESSGWF